MRQVESTVGINHHLNQAFREVFMEKEAFEKRSEGGKGVSGYLGEENIGRKVRRPVWLKCSKLVVAAVVVGIRRR